MSYALNSFFYQFVSLGLIIINLAHKTLLIGYKKYNFNSPLSLPLFIVR